MGRKKQKNQHLLHCTIESQSDQNASPKSLEPACQKRFSLFALSIFLILSPKLTCNPLTSSPPTSIESQPSVVISDWHIGTSLWQAAMLKKIGAPVEVYSLSGHKRYASNDPSFRENRLFTSLNQWSEEVIHNEFNKNGRWANLSWALCSFPPSYVLTLKKLPANIHLFLNVGHRIHISLSPTDIIPFTEFIANINNDSRYTLATMSEYDFHYIRYYTQVEPLRLPVVAEHIPLSLRKAPYSPKNRVVLIGPSHNTTTILGFDNDLKELNRLSASFAVRHGLKPYTFNFIKSLYPDDQATVENLAKHPAVLMNPYSAFSISMVELYHLNIPFFVPDNELLIDAMGDVRLYPLYQNETTVAQLEAAYPVTKSGYPYSPNDPSPEAQRYWLQFMFFNQVEHAQHWKTAEELFEKLYLQDLQKIHDDMQSENESLFNEQYSVWSSLLP